MNFKLVIRNVQNFFRLVNGNLNQEITMFQLCIKLIINFVGKILKKKRTIDKGK